MFVCGSIKRNPCDFLFSLLVWLERKHSRTVGLSICQIDSSHRFVFFFAGKGACYGFSRQLDS